MSKALTASPPRADLTPAQIKLIKDTVAKNASDDELKLFLYRCQEMGLDPLKPGQIFFIKYGNGPGTIVIGRDGFRSRAIQTGKHVGTKTGLLYDESGKLSGAWAEVFRSDWLQPARDEVLLEEYNTGKAQWQKMPATMIKKVAEVSALRMAFPEELSGLYSQEEMDQAKPAPMPGTETILDVVTKPAVTMASTPSMDSPGEYVVPFGKFKGSCLGNLDAGEIENYAQYLIKKASDDGKELRGQVLEFIEHAEAYVASKSSSPPDGSTDWASKVREEFS